MADITTALDKLGIDYTIRGDEAAACCPAHDDHSPSWSINLGTGMHHCLGGETVVMTRSGYRPIAELAGAEHELLTWRGNHAVWVTAPVKSYGQQQLWDVVLQRNGITKKIRATSGHRWFVRINNGSDATKWVERTTENLLAGHRLKSVYLPRAVRIKVSPWGVAHGFTYGDGTLTNKNAGGGARVTLWGSKDAALLKYFPLSHTRSVRTPNGVEGLEVGHLPRFFRTRPALTESPAYLYGWLAGYFAADGNVSKGFPSLSSAKREDLEFVREVCLRLGVCTYGITVSMRKGYGTEETPLYCLGFVRSTLSEDFFLIPGQRDSWLATKGHAERMGWVVQAVQPTTAVEEVFCAEVPDTHSFVLEDNILTGNCFSCGFGGGFARLVMQVRGASYRDSELWLKRAQVRFSGAAPRATQTALDTSWKYTEASLYAYGSPPASELDRRHVAPGACELFNILWDAMKGAWIFPIRDPRSGELWGWQEKDGHIFRNRPRSVAKSRAVFGLRSLEHGGRPVLVESPVDTARLYTAGVRGGVSSYGVSVSDYQLTPLLNRNSEIVLALDNDAAGIRETKRLAGRVWGRFLMFNYGESTAKDVGEMTDKEIIWGMEHLLTSREWLALHLAG